MTNTILPHSTSYSSTPYNRIQPGMLSGRPTTLGRPTQDHHDRLRLDVMPLGTPTATASPAAPTAAAPTAAAPEARTFTVSFFPRSTEPRGTQKKLTFDELCQELRICDVRPTKDGRMASGAIYDSDNVYRSNNNVIAVSLLFIDCDESHTLDELCERIEKLGVRAILYSTYSHGTPDTENHPDAHAPGERLGAH